MNKKLEICQLAEICHACMHKTHRFSFVNLFLFLSNSVFIIAIFLKFFLASVEQEGTESNKLFGILFFWYFDL